MKVVITGGCGFIGSRLAVRGLEEGWQIVAYDNFSRFTPENLANHKEHISVVQGDVEDFKKLKETLQGADLVFHLAGKSRVAGSIENPLEFFKANVMGTCNVFETCRANNSTRIIFASSWIVYSRDYIRFGVKSREGDALGPTNPYGLSKLVGEQYAKLYSLLYDKEIISLRFSNVYGPGDKERIIPFMIGRAIKGEPIRVDGDPRYVNFVHINDVIEALISVAKCPSIKSRVYNIGAPESLLIKDLANMIIKQCNSSSSIQIAPLPHLEYPYYCPNIDLARDELGFVPKVSFEDGINECVDWVVRSSNGDGYSRV